MAYKTILVHCDSSAALPHRLNTALDLSRRYGAHLVGVHVSMPFQSPAMDATFVPTDLYEMYEARTAEDMGGARAAFDKAVAASGLPAEWRASTGFADAELAQQARYADLLIVGQTDPDMSAVTPDDLPESVAMSAGKPVLVVPRAGARAMPGKSVMLCWNASRESARAASDALPFLQAAEKVVVLTVDPHATAGGHGAEPGADVAAWLSRHGAKVTVQREAAADAEVGGLILSRAADHGADLIVMGVYGHSRMREWVLGGVSRSLLESSNLPLLIAH
jgi:nucleotide-binding universal stress UspA family protein